MDNELAAALARRRQRIRKLEKEESIKALAGTSSHGHTGKPDSGIYTGKGAAPSQNPLIPRHPPPPVVAHHRRKSNRSLNVPVRPNLDRVSSRHLPISTSQNDTGKTRSFAKSKSKRPPPPIPSRSYLESYRNVSSSQRRGNNESKRSSTSAAEYTVNKTTSTDQYPATMPIVTTEATSVTFTSTSGKEEMNISPGLRSQYASLGHEIIGDVPDSPYKNKSKTKTIPNSFPKPRPTIKRLSGSNRSNRPPAPQTLERKVVPGPGRPKSNPPPRLKRMPSGFDFARAIYSFGDNDAYADVDGALNFEIGQVFMIKEKDPSGWWRGLFFDVKTKTPVGPEGIFPANYVEILDRKTLASFEESFDEDSEYEDIDLDANISVMTRKESRRLRRSVYSDSGEFTPRTVSEEVVADIQMDALEAKKKQRKKLAKFWFAVLELFTSEYKYLLDLQLCESVFVTPLSEKFKLTLVRSVFPGWQNMVVAHDGLLKQMESVLPNDLTFRSKYLKVSPKPITPDSSSSSSPNRAKHVSSELGGMFKDSLKVNMLFLGGKLETLETAFRENVYEVDIDYFTEDCMSFWQELTATLGVKLCNVIMRMSDVLKASIPYMSNYENALKTLNMLAETQPNVHKFIEYSSQNPLIGGLQLRDFLIKPVQRVCKYSLLLREIKKNSVDEACTRVATEAEQSLITVTNQVNETMRKVGSGGGLDETLIDVRTRFRPDAVVKKLFLNEYLFLPTTKLIRKDTIEVIEFPVEVMKKFPEATSNTKYETFVFLDLIIFTEPYYKFLTNAERFYIRAAVEISHQKIVTGLPPSFRGGCGLKISESTEVYSDSNLVIVAKDKETRDSWLANIRLMLEAFQDIEKRRDSVRLRSGTILAPKHGLSMYGDTKKSLARLDTSALQTPENQRNPQDDNNNPRNMKELGTNKNNKHPPAFMKEDSDPGEGQKMQNALLLAKEFMARKGN